MANLHSSQTPSQTVGPFFHYGLVFGGENILARDGVLGSRIVVTGRVIDGDGAAVPDALVEIWQADAAGIYTHPADPRHAQADPCFKNFGRCDTRHLGDTYRFETVKPGAVAGPNGPSQAPHLAVRIFSRGLLTHLATRVYFSDEAAANATDVTLASIEAARRGTLIALRDAKVSGAIAVYRHDFVLQGKGETVFFQP
jgi:protocatechuate 3,4-dioxygenase alpha subunit